MRNPHTYDIDKMSTKDMLCRINLENVAVIKAVDDALDEITAACDTVAASVENGGRVFYVGAGTSGRLGVCDAAECPPTFGVSPDLFVGLIAGGNECMFKAAENAEDDADLGKKDLESHSLSSRDAVVAISASGSAAYAVGALKYARSVGAAAIAITNNHDTALEKEADITVCADTGAEVITGSTRMKAGTAQKIILNMISTCAMVKCGYVYKNIMINLRPTNKKLKHRMIATVSELGGCDLSRAEQLLEENAWSIRAALDANDNSAF